MAEKGDLDKIRAHFQKTGGGSKGSDKNWFKVPEPAAGESASKVTIRMLGPWSKSAGGFPYYVGGLHYGIRIGGRDRAIACPESSDPQRGICPVCQLVSALNESGKYKKVADRIRVQRKYWINLIDRADGKVKMYGGNKKFIEAILDASDEGNVWSLKSGRDMVIKRRGTGFNTRYSYSFRSKESPSGLNGQALYMLDKDVMEWMPYSQMVDILKANFEEEINKMGVRFKKIKDAEVEEEVKPKKKAKPVVEEEDEEDEIEDIDEDDEEEIEEDEDEDE